MALEQTVLYLCGRCYSAEASPGPCPNCGLPRLEFCPGALADLSRRPPMDAQGRLLSRAPLWWVRRAAPYLAREGPVGRTGR